MIRKLFSADTGNGGEVLDPVITPETKETKTFTQEDINRVIGEAKKSSVAKVLKELGIEDVENTKEGMKKFKEWQDSQKTESEKLTGKLTEYEKSLQEKDKQVNDLNAKFTALSKGVQTDKVDKVIKLLSAYEGETIDAKIDAILTEFPEYKKGSAPASIGGQSTGQQTNSLDSAKEQLNKIMGLKK
jgi:vacuolar-type H+-ATPase subunit I/STV1